MVIETKGNLKNKIYPVLKALPIVFTAVLIILYWVLLRGLSFMDIVNYVPSGFFAAALAIIGIYALKSLSVVFPKMIISMSSGVIFPLWAALTVNLAGLWVCLSLPYFVGRFSGRETVNKLVAKYPKAKKLEDTGLANGVFSGFMLRLMVFIPGDIASMFLGASNMPYHKYILGSLLGVIPGMITHTLMGAYINKPYSLPFLFAFIALVGISFILSLWVNKYTKAKEKSKAKAKV